MHTPARRRATTPARRSSQHRHLARVERERGAGALPARREGQQATAVSVWPGKQIIHK